MRQSVLSIQCEYKTKEVGENHLKGKNTKTSGGTTTYL